MRRLLPIMAALGLVAAPFVTRLTAHGAVPGDHAGRWIPRYWSYAKNFVLQDHMFEPNASWSLPAHLFLTSEWSATCSVLLDPFSCENSLNQQASSSVPMPKNNTTQSWPGVHYDWTDLTYLFYEHNVSWRYYL